MRIGTTRLVWACATLTLLAGVTTGDDKPKPGDESKTGWTQLTGNWVLESQQYANPEKKADVKKGSGLILSEGSFEPLDGKGVIRVGPRKAKATIDPTKKPAHLDVIWHSMGEDLVVECIYKLDGDTLTICLGDSFGGNRPDKFEAGTKKGQGEKLWVLKREKK